MGERERYLDARHVIPPDLLERCQRQLEGHRAVITFEHILYTELNREEEKLGAVLAHQCRQQVFGKRVRQVYFPGARKKLELSLTGAAQELLDRGHSMQAVADALGVTRKTLQNWGCESRRESGTAGHVLEYELTEDQDALTEGIEIVLDRIKKRKPRISGMSNSEALARMATALRTTPEAVRKRAYAASHAVEALREIEITQE